MRVKFVLSVVIAGTATGLIAGCASTTNATDSTISYLHGDQHAKVGATPPRVVDATIAAGDELNLKLDTHEADGLIGRVVLHTVDGTKVEVSVKGEDNDKSEVTVRVGTFGDKELQERVLEKIKAHLLASDSASRAGVAVPTPPPAPAPTPTVTPTPAAPPVAPAPAPAPANPLAPPPGATSAPGAFQ